MLLRRISRLFVLLLIAGTAIPSAAGAYSVGSEGVVGSIVTPQYTHEGVTYGPFGLDFSYTAIFNGTRLTANVEINFTFDALGGFTAGEKAAYRTAVETNVEGIWNNKYVIVDQATRAAFPLAVDLTTAGPFDQTVLVRRGSGGTNALNWFTGDSPQVNAHEFGHLLGLYDEYIGGAIDRYPDPTLSDTGLMGLGALLPDPEMLPRYYAHFLDEMGRLNPGVAFALAVVPAPATLLLVFAGGALAVVLGRRGRRRTLRIRTGGGRP